MKAIRVEEYGGRETLRLRNLELPNPGPGEVHVKLRAAGLNFVDIYLKGSLSFDKHLVVA